ncbi:MAG TPA: hypothetical protein VKC53_03545 [Patescibacteria group bacterium]|nr:hypothetical protein [Patescibacteria group bacterium]
MKFSIRLLYLYLFSFIGLLVVVIGSIRLFELGLKVYIFKGADQYTFAQPVKVAPDGKEISLTQEEKDQQKKDSETETNRQRERELSGALAMILVGLPLYKYHWNIIKRESKKS